MPILLFHGAILIDCGGGQLNNWGPHIIDHALQFLDYKVAEVWSDLKRVAAVGDAEKSEAKRS